MLNKRPSVHMSKHSDGNPMDLDPEYIINNSCFSTKRYYFGSYLFVNGQIHKLPNNSVISITLENVPLDFLSEICNGIMAHRITANISCRTSNCFTEFRKKD